MNDLEAPAFECAPQLLALKQDIASLLVRGDPGGGGVMMSGSGTSVYALLRRAQADKGKDEGLSSGRAQGLAAVLEKHPSVRHFKCDFISKVDDVREWYQYKK